MFCPANMWPLRSLTDRGEPLILPSQLTSPPSFFYHGFLLVCFITRPLQQRRRMPITCSPWARALPCGSLRLKGRRYFPWLGVRVSLPPTGPQQLPFLQHQSRGMEETGVLGDSWRCWPHSAWNLATSGLHEHTSPWCSSHTESGFCSLQPKSFLSDTRFYAPFLQELKFNRVHQISRSLNGYLLQHAISAFIHSTNTCLAPAACQKLWHTGQIQPLSNLWSDIDVLKLLGIKGFLKIGWNLWTPQNVAFRCIGYNTQHYKGSQIC